VRENRKHGSEGGEGNLPDPYRAEASACRFVYCWASPYAAGLGTPVGPRVERRSEMRSYRMTGGTGQW
jgi:hypothetical protein